MEFVCDRYICLIRLCTDSTACRALWTKQNVKSGMLNVGAMGSTCLESSLGEYQHQALY